MRRILTILLGLCLPVLTACQSSQTEKPVVISTIKPIQALVYAIAGGADSPLELRQLLPDGASPHHYALKPSDSRALEQASLIFRIDSGLEVFLDKALAGLPTTTNIVTLTLAPGIEALPLRSPHQHDEDSHDAASEDKHANEHEAATEASSQDLHIWLNPRNAIAMSHTITQALSQLDPAHTATYQTNAKQLIQSIEATDAHIRQQLQPLRDQAYLSFHDAWQHFDHHYGLTFAGAVTLDPARQPGAKHVQAIRQIIQQKQAVCLFQEPQFPPALIQTLVEGSSIKVGELDPLGMAIPLDQKTYIHLLTNAADTFVQCLASRN